MSDTYRTPDSPLGRALAQGRLAAAAQRAEREELDRANRAAVDELRATLAARATAIATATFKDPPMKLRALLALSLALLAPACDPPSSPDTDTGVATSGSTGEPADTSGGDAPGYVCEDVGVACDVNAPDCAAGLDCVPRPEAPHLGVCASRCILGELPCATGWCDQRILTIDGICRDGDGLPVGLCEGAPSCAGDSCEEGQCANGLTCILGGCAIGCETAADCGAGQTCLAGACFTDGELTDPCN